MNGIIEHRLKIKARRLYPKDARKQLLFVENVLRKTGLKPKEMKQPSIAQAFE